MSETGPFDTRQALIARAEGYQNTEPSFARFLKAVAETLSAEDIADRQPETLEARFRKSYGRLGRRELASHDVYIVTPPDEPELETVEVFSADMPFIIDSVLAAIRASGGVIRLMAHPVLRFDPTTYRVLDQPAIDSRLESFLHVEIAPLTDVVQREMMKKEIDEALTDANRAVAGWKPMLRRLNQAMQDWHDRPPQAPSAEMAEAIHFLGWLAEDNFTFLGMREYRLEGEGEGSGLKVVPDSGIGILEDAELKVVRSGTRYVEMTPQHQQFLAEPAPLLVTKANVRSRVHRRVHMDYVGIKLYGVDGAPTGELRLVGLFTSQSYATPSSEVPLIRRKVAEVVDRAGLELRSHSGKALLNVLNTYPREELFQIAVPQLADFAVQIADLTDRPRVRVLPRIDRFDNFVSVLVYVPRDRYDSEVRTRIGAYLAQAYKGRVSAFSPFFPEGDLVRVHFILGRNGGPTPRPNRPDVEAAVADIVRTFNDRLIAAAGDREAVRDFIDAFDAAYQHANPAEEALADIEVLRLLPDARSMALRLLPHHEPERLRLKVYHRERPIPLSDRVPMLENFGFRVIDEDSHAITPQRGGVSYIHDMQLAAPGTLPELERADAERIENAILAVWHGEAESDRLNQLTSFAGLGWQDVELLRALVRYLRQLGIAYSNDYLNAVLAQHGDVAAAMVRQFHALHDPHFAGHRERTLQVAADVIAAAIDSTASLDEDRILRRLTNLVTAILRTNAYQRDETGARRPALALKFDCAKVDGMPAPRPYREIFVYSPRVEGLHLRFGAIARGGLRWSDRPEDFRTEVLGLVKAQQVKNAIIVPVGAKGAFVPRRLPGSGDRDAVQREATASYKVFVSTLLDVTDNLDGDQVIPPPDVIRLDGDDPYLVVAADKGTARYSDTANAIAVGRDYWLGDAFASGGSAGYDHKEMGITARGGWEAVKRHFREMDFDIQSRPFRAVGVGDMSGDVFGNGMLLSPMLRLVAAFDHRHIFIDPEPDAERSFAERQRLFALPRSSWQDYDASLISKGGGVYARDLKTVPLHAEARKVLGLSHEAVTPAELMRAILKADVDLLWFGGIGTYVKASTETDAEAGDKANDALRVDGRALRARVVGEGANLAVTQKGRIEYALAGGRINTDAIDNSAGVNSSDLEVNIKIALGPLVRQGDLSDKVRNEFLAKMTDEVAALCLRNNYLQTLALSVEERRGPSALPEHLALMQALEAAGILDREVEALADDASLLQRAQGGRGLTRPELAVLLALAKNQTYAALCESAVPDDPYLGRELYRYFPEMLVETFPEAVLQHRLRREVIATVLANAMINRGGPALVNELAAATSAGVGRIAAAYAAARDIYDTPDLNRALDGLDGKVSGKVQLSLYAEVQALLRREALWLLRYGDFEHGLAPLVSRYAEGLAEIRDGMMHWSGSYLGKVVTERLQRYVAGGVPRDLAQRFAELPVVTLASDICLVAERAGAPVSDTAAVFFGVLETFQVGRILEEGAGIVLTDRYDRMALDRALANLMRAVRELTADVLRVEADGSEARLASWRSRRPGATERLVNAVRALTEGEMTVSRLSVAAGLLADFVRD